MTSGDAILADGEVLACHRGGVFEIRLDSNDHVVRARPCGKMAKSKVRILLGDSVRVELSPYDLLRGRIVWRYI